MNPRENHTGPAEVSRPPVATILIIDDDVATRETLCALLEGDGYQLIMAENGPAGLAQAVAGDPDVILLDVMLPGMDGFEVCRRLRREGPLAEVPIVMLSALEAPEARLEGLEAGADDFIAKPFDRVELRARLKSITRLNRYRRLEAERSKFQHLVETLEQRIADRTHELATLYAVASMASEALELQPMLDNMLARTLTALDLPHGAIHLVDQGGGQLHLAAQVGIAPEIQARIRLVTPGFGLAGWVVEHNEPLALTNVSNDPRILTIGQVSGFSIYLSAPLRAHGQVLGAISVFGDAEQRLNPETMALLTTIADQIGLATESMHLRHQARQTAVLEERGRMARELHDSVAQGLYSLTLLVSAGQRAAQDGNLARTSRHLDQIGATALQALKEMRLLVYDWQPSTLGLEGLVPALQRRLEVVEGHAHIQTELLVEGQPPLPEAAELELYGLAQEALNNALKHAQATKVTIRLAETAEGLALEVCDNGQGFDLQSANARRGLGLAQMRERAARLGGRCEVITAPGRGTVVKVIAPGGGRPASAAGRGQPADG